MKKNTTPIDHDSGNALPILRLIGRTRSLLRSSWVVTGVGITVGVLLSTVLIVTVSDVVMAWSPVFRMICLVLIVVPAAWVFVIGALRPLLRGLSSAIVARRIEREMPGIHNRIVSCVDLAAGNAPTQSSAFHRRLIHEALQRIGNFRPQDALDRYSLKRSAIFALGSLVVLAVAFSIASARLPNALARILKPFADIPPVASVLYHVLVGDQKSPGSYDTLRGSDLQFNVIVTKGEVDRPGGDDPLRLEIFTVDKKGKEKRLSFTFPAVEENHTSYRLTGLQHSLTYRVYGSGTWSKQYRVNMLDRPEIVALQTVVRYPAYIPGAPVVGAPNVPHVTGPRRSIAEVVVDVAGDAVEGQIQMLQLRRLGLERFWFNDAPPAGVEFESAWLWDETLTSRRLHGATSAEGAHSHGFDNAKNGFEIRRGDALFADVFLVPWRRPETIMVEWHDGESWEHRAYWGADSITRGQSDTASRRFMGALPQSAKLTRLAVAPELVGLENKRLSGIRFTVFGGLTQPSVIGMRAVDIVARHEGQRIEFYDIAGNELEALPGKQKGSVSVYIPSETGQDNYQFTEEGVIIQHLRSYAKDYVPGTWTFVETATSHPPPEGKKIPKKLPAGCFWGAAGVLPADPQLDRELVVAGRFPLAPLSGNSERSQWSGTFPLLRNGYYRVELRNRLNHPNQRAQEGRITALLDNPPQISVDQPGIDLVVSAPVGVAIHFSAYDDFGVDKIILQVQKNEDEPFESRVVKSYDTTRRSASGSIILNLIEENAAIGEILRFRLEARDRKKQSAVSPVHSIRIVADDVQAADQVFDVYEKETETFRDKLETLLDEQEKIHEAVVNLAAKKEKVDPAANTEFHDQELRNKLTELANREDDNVELGKALAEELEKLTEQSPEIDFLPPEIARQQELVQQAFVEMAVDPMAELSEMLREPEAKIEDIERQSEQVQENLGAVKDRMEALAKAQTDSRDDLEDALAELREDLMSQDADAASRELEDLKEFMDELARDLEILKGVQEELIADNEKELSSRLRESLAEDQTELEKEIGEKIKDVHELLDPLRDKPLFPERPYNPEQEEYLVPPAENDTPNSDITEKTTGEDGSPEDEEFEAEIFMPALGGPTPKLDPRFEDDIREQLEKSENSDPEKNKMRSRQFEQVQELDLAQKAVESDQQSVEEMINALGEEVDSLEAMQKLAAMMNSESVQQAKEMLQRLEQGDNHRPSKPGVMGDPLAQLPDPIDGESMADILTGLVSLDLSARTVIMKMQPRQREQMLQGLREEGPEGYRSFIRDYFQRLTRVQTDQ
jgi:hypothetical protein